MPKKRLIDGGKKDYYKHYYLNKYFNLFVDSFEFDGLNYREIKYLIRKFWNDGTVAAFKFANIDKVGFAPWCRITWDLYGMPETITLLNERGSNLIPMKKMVVDKEAVIGWIQANEKPIATIVNYYVDRIAQIECVINTNLHLQKMPFVIPVEKEDAAKVRDVIERILNDEIAIEIEDIDPAIFKAVMTNAPYLVDKLYNYKASLENELKTYLGINNNGKEKEEQLQLAEVNANNDEINGHQHGFIEHLQDFFKRIDETLGVKISVKCNREKAVADGQVHNGDKTGSKGEESNED